MACARCLGPLGMRPERRTLLPAGFISLVEFERQVFHQLRRSSIDASLLLCVEDLLWLLSRPLVEGGKLAVHALPDTVFRLPQHIYRLPREKPMAGRIRRRSAAGTVGASRMSSARAKRPGASTLGIVAQLQFAAIAACRYESRRRLLGLFRPLAIRRRSPWMPRRFSVSP
jgi:hypothetical protein